MHYDLQSEVTFQINTHTCLCVSECVCLSFITPQRGKHISLFSCCPLAADTNLQKSDFRKKKQTRAVVCVLGAARLGVRKIHKLELFFKRDSCLPPPIHHVATTSMRSFSWISSCLDIWEHRQHLSSHKLCIENNPAFSGQFTRRTALSHLRQRLYPSASQFLQPRPQTIHL